MASRPGSTLSSSLLGAQCRAGTMKGSGRPRQRASHGLMDPAVGGMVVPTEMSLSATKSTEEEEMAVTWRLRTRRDGVLGAQESGAGLSVAWRRGRVEEEDADRTSCAVCSLGGANRVIWLWRSVHESLEVGAREGIRTVDSQLLRWWSGGGRELEPWRRVLLWAFRDADGGY
ncbi:hypothetical protein BS50DRAFT_389659 [Corynespora cassiicola Philippines]|uniref:Uncharacterized protein n=1 Tax=Corynespora cassiicola Philippines TaxID=1448308 RepID=A0A2T2NPN0_CORCC|nr:hypothetical protein BS50DRAFT_389659 [Corynespora cassiicola Philippines]